jgi:Spy/CpxP family protein refolding chaperone
MKMKLLTVFSILTLANAMTFAQAPKDPAKAAPVTINPNPGFRAVPPASGPQALPRPAAPANRQTLREPISDEQKAKLMEANKTMQQASQPLYAQMRQARLELDKLINAEKLDEAAVRAQAAELGRLEGELALIRARHQASIRGFLGTNQLSALQPPPGTNIQRRLNTVVDRKAVPPQPAQPAAPATRDANKK